MAACSSDSHCKPNELCFAQTSWFEDQNSSATGCACNSFYAWKGPDCEDRSNETTLFALWAFLLVIISLVGFLVSIYTLRIVVSFDDDYYARKKTFCQVWNSSITLAWLCIIGFFGTLLWTTSLFASTVAVTGSFLLGDIYSDSLKGRHNVYGALGNFICGIITPVLCVYTAILWLQVVERFSGSNFVNWKGSFRHYKRILLFFLLVSMTATVFVGVLGRINYYNDRFYFLAYTTMPIYYIYGFIFLGAAVKLSKLLKSVEFIASRQDSHAAERRVSSEHQTKAEWMEFLETQPDLGFDSYAEKKTKQRESLHATLNKEKPEKVVPPKYNALQSTNEIVSQHTPAPKNQTEWGIMKEAVLSPFMSPRLPSPRLPLTRLPSPGLPSLGQLRSRIQKKSNLSQNFDSDLHILLQNIRMSATIICIGLLFYSLLQSIWVIYSLRHFQMTPSRSGWREGINPGMPYSLLKAVYFSIPISVLVVLFGFLVYVRDTIFFTS